MAVIDKEIEEKDDAPEIREDSEIADALHDETKDADLDGGAADPKDGEVVGKEEGDLSEEKVDGDEVEKPDLIRNLTEKIAELEKKISTPTPLTPEERAPVQPISEEEWSRYEEERGIPRTAQTWVTNALVRVVSDVKREMDNRFARFDRQDTMGQLAKDPEFSDASKYPKEVDQYLAKVDPRFHSNVDVLKDAVIWARGMNYKKNVQTIQNDKEKNKRIAGVARPAAGGGSKGSGKSVSLTALEKSAAAATGMSESEYASLKGKSKVIAS